MREPEENGDVQAPMERTNWTTIGLIGGLVLLVLIIGYFAIGGNSDQDKLTNAKVSSSTSSDTAREKICASSGTYDLIKRELFRRAAQVRGSDQSAFDSLSGYAVVRMDNPVMESQDRSTGAVNCSGSLSIDLPPGVAVVGGRRTLTSDIDYTVTKAADGSGNVVLLRNADTIITPLATLARVGQPAQEPTQASPGTEEGVATTPAAPVPPGETQAPQPPAPPQPPRTASARPSFDCASARTRGEIAVCSEAGLAALDRQMAAQYSRAFAIASPEQRWALRQSAQRFYAYRDRCPNNACIGDAYTGRIREIRDIMEGRWQPQ